MPNLRLHDRVLIVKPNVFLKCGYIGKRADGKERHVFTEHRPVLAGQIGTVVGVTTVKTGMFRAKHQIKLSDDSWIDVPSHIEGEVPHKILKVRIFFKGKPLGDIQIEQENCEREVPEIIRSIWDRR